MASFYYFAYGSNMLSKRLQERCPSARAISPATLNGWELRWHKRSKKDGSGKCDIVQSHTTDSVVLGVLYQVDMSERKSLDRFEGLGNGYDEFSISPDSHPDITAITYRASDVDPALKPYTWYKTLVLAGAEENHLPKDYIDILQSVSAVEDHDRDRHKKEMGILEPLKRPAN